MNMPVTKDVYDQLKIDKLKHFLEAQAEKGQAKPYEIYVDNLKVVGKTDDPKEFDSYESYIDEDTEKIRILIYNYNLSPRNDQYCFMVQRNKMEKPLNGLGELDDFVQEKLAARDREHELNKLREDLEATRQELQETEEYAEGLEKEIQHLKENKFKIGSAHLGELTSVALETFVRRNVPAVDKFLGGDVLAGIMQPDKQEREMTQSSAASGAESQASFKKETEPEVTEDEKRDVEYLRKLRQNFSPEQAQGFNTVLGAMVENPSVIASLLQFIHQTQ
jgi:hypothetical protein